MTLNSLTPNAHYDMAHGRPSVIEHDNDGSYLYRLNIVEEKQYDEKKKKEVQIGWMCYETRCWTKVDKGTIERAVIRSVLDDCSEFNLVNSYNKHVMGVLIDESAVTRYREYLQFTIDLGNQIEQDLSNN